MQDTIQRPALHLPAWAWIVLALALLAAPACRPRPASAQQSAPSTQPTSKPARTELPKVVPWIECNFARYDEKVIAGLTPWQELTDTAIVSTMPGRASLFSRLRQRVPHMKIIPGLKTRDLLPRFDSSAGWHRIAKEVTQFARSARTNVVLLEHEGALKSFLNKNAYDLDQDRLRAALAQMPDDIFIIWYPGQVGETDEVRARSDLICTIADDVLRLQFTDLSRCGPAADRYFKYRGSVNRLQELADDPVVPLLYCYGPGSRWWQDQQLPDILSEIPSQWVILYPGLARWDTAAEEIGRAMRKP